MHGQKFYQVKLHFGEGNLFPVIKYFSLRVVDNQFSLKLKLFSGCHTLLPPQVRHDSGIQFIHAERFHNIIVSADHQAIDPVLFLHPCREEENGTAHVIPDPSAHLIAVHTRHIDIQKDHVRLYLHFIQGFLPVCCSINLISLQLKIIFQHAADILFIIHDQNFLSHISSHPALIVCRYLIRNRYGYCSLRARQHASRCTDIVIRITKISL